jgi:hypothetical protein
MNGIGTRKHVTRYNCAWTCEKSDAADCSILESDLDEEEDGIEEDNMQRWPVQSTVALTTRGCMLQRAG